MEELIKDINAIPGVDGTCFLAPNGELIESSFESPAKEKMINVGKMLTKLIISGTSQMDDLSSLSICYEESILNVRKLKSNSFLIIRHSSATDSNLINITIESSGAFDNSQQVAMEPHNKPVIIEQQQPLKSEKPVEVQTSSAEKMMIQPGPLSNILAGMQRALTKLEGPKARETFRLALKDWTQNHEPKLSNLKFLADLLSKGLSDQDKVERFRKMILPYLSHARDN